MSQGVREKKIYFSEEEKKEETHTSPSPIHSASPTREHASSISKKLDNVLFHDLIEAQDSENESEEEDTCNTASSLIFNRQVNTKEN